LHECLPLWAEPYLEDTQVIIRWHLTPANIQAPAGSLNIIFSNLLRNALRAAGAHGTLDVEVRPGVLIIRDNGPGISSDELPLVFEPGFRGRDGGTGIGLYVAQSLASRRGWQLALSNRVDARGAVAQLTFSS